MSSKSFNFAQSLNPSKIKESERNSFKPKITIYSKEDDTRLLLKTILEIWGFVVDEADCVRRLSAGFEREKSDLIIFDFSFPFDEYLKTISEIRKELVFIKVPIIGISGFAQSGYRALAIAGGADEYLVKPVDFDQLKELLKDHLQNDFDLDAQIGVIEPLSGGKH
ncbi:MAG: response regulator [Pyrinomonadaceae bacterium]|nr:response regulator [Pyrinomonadaceae bacterium]